MRIAFTVLLYFELAIVNVSLLRLLREKIDKIKSLVFSSRVTPLVYYSSRALGDALFNAILYAIFYGVLSIGARDLINRYDQGAQFNNLWLLLFIWKLRYVFIGYLVSHLITGCVDQIMRFYLYIYAALNAPFIVISVFYPGAPFDYFFDCGSIVRYSFQPSYRLDFGKEVIALLLNLSAALLVSTLIDNYRLGRNFNNQSRARRLSFDALLQAPPGSSQVGAGKSDTDRVEVVVDNTLDAGLIPRDPDPGRTLRAGPDSLKIRGLAKAYGVFSKTRVIEDVSFDLSQQTAFGLVGPNGAGKSTIFRIIASENAKTGGHVRLDGSMRSRLLTVADSLYWKQSVGLCYQNDFLYDDFTVEQHIAFFSRLNGLCYRKQAPSGSGAGDYVRLERDERSQHSPDQLEPVDSEVILEQKRGPSRENALSASSRRFLAEIPDTHNPFISSVEKALDILRFRQTKARNLSSGNKRKLCILLSLLKKLDLLLWDEATCGLDVLARHSIRQLLFALKSANQAKLMITTHFLNDIDLYCDCIGILRHGRFAFKGSTEELRHKYGGYQVSLTGAKSGVEHALEQLQARAKFEVLERKQVSRLKVRASPEHASSSLTRRRPSLQSEQPTGRPRWCASCMSQSLTGSRVCSGFWRSRKEREKLTAFCSTSSTSSTCT